MARFSDDRMSWKKIDQRGSTLGRPSGPSALRDLLRIDALASSWAPVHRESQALGVGLGEAFGQPLAPR